MADIPVQQPAQVEIDQPFYNNLRQLHESGQLSPSDERDFQMLDQSGRFNAFKQPADVGGAQALTQAVNRAPLHPPTTSTTLPPGQGTGASLTEGTPETMGGMRPIPEGEQAPVIPLNEMKPIDLPDEMPRGFWEAFGDKEMLPKLTPGSLYSADSMEGFDQRRQMLNRSYGPDNSMTLGRVAGGVARMIGAPLAAGSAGLEAATGSREAGNVAPILLPMAAYGITHPRQLLLKAPSTLVKVLTGRY